MSGRVMLTESVRWWVAEVVDEEAGPGGCILAHYQSCRRSETTKEVMGRQGDVEAESVYTSIKPTDSSAASQAGIHSGNAVVAVRWKRGDETSVSICTLRAPTRPDGIGEQYLDTIRHHRAVVKVRGRTGFRWKRGR